MDFDEIINFALAYQRRLPKKIEVVCIISKSDDLAIRQAICFEIN